MPVQDVEWLNIGHIVGCCHSSCNSLAVGTTQRTRYYNPHIAGRRSNCDCGQASSREKDILIQFW